MAKEVLVKSSDNAPTKILGSQSHSEIKMFKLLCLDCLIMIIIYLYYCNMLIIVCSVKKLGDLNQVMEDHCYSWVKRDSKDIKVGFCAENDTKTGTKFSEPGVDKTSNVANNVKVTVQYLFS